MIQGFLMVTGRTQEGVKDFIFKALRSYLIIAISGLYIIGKRVPIRTQAKLAASDYMTMLE